MSDSDSPPPPAASEASDHTLQPFFVLHKSLPQESTTVKEPAPRKTRRKIDVSQSPSKLDALGSEEPDDHQRFNELRLRAFKASWSKIESTIKDVLRQIDLNLFDEVRQWVLERFGAIESTRTNHINEISWPFPVIDDEISKRIQAGLMITRNAEFVDDLLTFHELGTYLRSNGCHVANLSSLDFVAKHGVGSCLRSLLRQLVAVATDAADISILASWYCEPGNYVKPIVIIIEDTEQCNGSVLAEFIMILSEWIVKVPIILLLGISTTINALQKLLPSNALQLLQTSNFTLESPHERMSYIIQEALIKQYYGFSIGYKVALFLRNYFLRHDGTITAFIKALKIACTKHFCMEPLSFLVHGIQDEDYKSFMKQNCDSLPSKLLGYAFSLPSCSGGETKKKTADTLLMGLQELFKLKKCWSSVLMCLFEVGKYSKTQLFDLFCEAISPELYKKRASVLNLQVSSTNRSAYNGTSGLVGGFISNVIQRVRDLPVESLVRLVKSWGEHTQEISEIHEKVKDLQSLLSSRDDCLDMKRQRNNMHRSVSRCSSITENSTSKMNEKAATLMEDMVRDYLTPIECIPFHEIICFKHVDPIQEALIGDPRRTVQIDLLHSRTYIQCICCPRDGNAISPSMHDTSIIYSLAQEHGDLINLHDWYQSFKAIILSSVAKSKRKRHQSPVSKKANGMAMTPDPTAAIIQARFSVAVKELQIAGLLRMPSKRRPDYVQRVAFGI